MFIKKCSLGRIFTATLLTLLVCSGCGLIYKQNIQQGNALEQEDLDQLYIGMNKRQVLFVLGSPSVHDPFQQQRWDYVQTFSRRGNEMVQKTVTLRFEDELLSEIIGVDDGLSAIVEPDDDTQTDAGNTVASSGEADAAPDPQTATVEAAKEEVLEPEVTGLGERTVEEREFEEDMGAMQQRSSDDLTSPDIDG
jgi:outer membrane protein assembly factor BamE